MDTPLQRLRQALEAQRQALDKLEGALRGFEETLPGEASGRPDSRALELLSMAEVCRALGMGKSRTYRRVKSGEIPSVIEPRSVRKRGRGVETPASSTPSSP